MRIAVPHNTTREDARRIIDRKMSELMSSFGGHAEEVEHNWTGDILDFRGKARGFSVKGTVEVTETEMVIDAKLPMIAMAFEPRIRGTIEREAAEMFRKG